MAQKASSCTQISKSSAERAEVNAVAGSGKTSTLLMRLMYWAGLGIPADKILILSFSKAAVGELRRRLKAKLATADVVASNAHQTGSANTNLSQVTIKTAHAFAKGFLGKQTVLTDKLAKALLSRAIKSVQKDCQKSLRQGTISEATFDRRMKLLVELGEQQNLAYVLKFLAVARAGAMTLAKTAQKPQFADLVPYLAALRVVRKKYEASKKKEGVIDYGDMLLQATDAIQAGAPVPYTHILVDEYQDCSPAQVLLLAALANRDGCNIMVFGDPGQAIYGFGGSCYTPLSSVLNNVQELSLPGSHRLTAENAALASAIRQLPPDQAIQAKRHGPPPVLVISNSEFEQAERIADDIQQLIASGTPPENIAVLGRIKALLHPVEQQLLTKKQHSTRLQVIRSTRHSLRVLRLVHLVERSEKSNQKITAEMLQLALPRLIGGDKSLWADAATALKKVHTSSLEGRYRLCGKQYLRLLGGVRHDRDRQHDVNRWETLCRDHPNAKTMRDAVVAMDKRAIVTGTIHAVKGMEWDHVFVVGATDGYMPFYLAHGNNAAEQEERNLLYVAVTRASKTVRLYHAPCEHTRSHQRFKTPCRFLDSAVRDTLQVDGSIEPYGYVDLSSRRRQPTNRSQSPG
jgi:DNA helicase-2/ATP-dependent DNA helicase PcrA